MTNFNPTSPPSFRNPLCRCLSSEWQSIRSPPDHPESSWVCEVVSRWQPLPSVALEPGPASHALRQFQLSRHQTTHTANISRTNFCDTRRGQLPRWRRSATFHAERGETGGVPWEGRSTGAARRRRRRSHLVPPNPNPSPTYAAVRLDDHERPVRLDDEQPRGSLLNKCRIRSAAHSPTRCACAENKGRRATRRCQAQASIEKRVAAAPKSRPSYHRPPSASPASRKFPRSQLCPPANPPPDSDSPLSAARVTLRAPATGDRRHSPLRALNTSFY